MTKFLLSYSQETIRNWHNQNTYDTKLDTQNSQLDLQRGPDQDYCLFPKSFANKIQPAILSEL